MYAFITETAPRLCKRALLGLLCSAVLAAPAHAQLDESTPVPTGAPTVTTTASGAAVIAWLAGGQMCSTVQEPGRARPSVAAATRIDPESQIAPLGCVTMPAPFRYDGGPLGTIRLGAGRQLTWGYAGLGTAAIQHKARGHVVAEAATSSPGALPAPVADVRFWAIETDDAAPANVDEVALLDDAGVVRRAFAPDRFGGISNAVDTGVDPEPTGPVLRHGRVGRATWELRRRVMSVLAPTPLEPERRARQACVAFVVRAARTTQWGSAPCDDLLARTPMAVTTSSSCMVGAAVAVIAAATVRRVVVVTGDGTHRAVRLVALVAGERAGALVLGAGIAVRRVIAFGAGGRRLAVSEIGHGPTPNRPSFCAPPSGNYGVVQVPPERLGTAPHTPHVTDHGVELCATVDRAPRIPADCALPPIAPDSARISITRTADGRHLFGIVAGEVAAARITLTDRSTQTLPAAPLPGYNGIYADVVRAIAADLPGPNAVWKVELLNDRGRVLSPEASANVDPTAWGRPVTVLPAAHGVPAVLAVPADTVFSGLTCVVFGSVRDDAFDCAAGLVNGQASTGSGTVRVEARCTPRRMLISAQLRHASDRLVVRTKDGRTIRSRMVPFPSGAGIAARGRFFALAVLGPRDAPAEALVRGRSPNRVTIDLPTAGRQCGYSTAPGQMDAFTTGLVGRDG
jgi:hypothetical protein